jgi:hypothetical protein
MYYFREKNKRVADYNEEILAWLVHTFDSLNKQRYLGLAEGNTANRRKSTEYRLVQQKHGPIRPTTAAQGATIHRF